MIADTLSTITQEISGLWSWMIGIIAGWGITFTAVVVAVVYAHVRISRLRRQIDSYNNQRVSEDRDLSFRLRRLEK